MGEILGAIGRQLKEFSGLRNTGPRARLADAELLLVYCVRHGIEISTSTLNSVLMAKKEIGTGNLSLASESSLWVALDDLSKRAAPVTVYTLEVNTTTWKRLYFVLFLIVLVTLLWLQFFWFIGATLTKELGSLEIDKAKISAEVEDVSASPSDTKGLKSKNGSTAQAAGNTASTTTNRPSESSDDWATQATLLDSELSLEARIKAKQELLAAWVRDASWVPVLRTGDPKTFDSLVKANSIEETSHFLADGIRLYALPLLYGLLGALIYVLRKIARDGELYTGEGDWIRICFGAAAGIGMGLFFGQDSAQLAGAGPLQAAASSLSPFALAFAGGYSADILFAALDRLVSAFADKEATNQRSPKTSLDVPWQNAKAPDRDGAPAAISIGDAPAGAPAAAGINNSVSSPEDQSSLSPNKSSNPR